MLVQVYVSQPLWSEIDNDVPHLASKTNNNLPICRAMQAAHDIPSPRARNVYMYFATLQKVFVAGSLAIDTCDHV